MKNLAFSFVFALMGVAFFSFDDTRNENAPKAAAWEVDLAHSSVSFEINHFFTPVRGTFDDFKGSLLFDQEDLEGSRADFTIQVESVNTKNEKRDKHLQSEDFFSAKKYPIMRFVSTSFTSKGNKQFEATGQLTIRDVTKDLTLPFEVLGVQDHPMKKGHVLTGMRAEALLNRTDFGVGTGSWAATAVVGDKVKITILLEATRKK